MRPTRNPSGSWRRRGQQTAKQHILAGQKAIRSLGACTDAKTGEGIAGASVYMMALDGTNTPGRPLRTGSDGGFRANGVKAGAYKFFCNSSGSSKYPTSVSSPYVQATVDPGQSVDDVDFAFEAGIPISGIVYDRGGETCIPSKRESGSNLIASSRIRVNVRGRYLHGLLPRARAEGTAKRKVRRFRQLPRWGFILACRGLEEHHTDFVTEPNGRAGGRGRAARWTARRFVYGRQST